jgi:hypothetical protein
VPFPGPNGKFQLFSLKPIYQRDVCALWHWDSFEQSFGFSGFKFIKQVWVEYQSPIQVRFTIYRDYYLPLFTVILPAHPYRDVERFYVPAYGSPTFGSPAQPNKSRMYRFHVDAADESSPVVKIYRDSTRVETMQLDGAQRGAYQQHELSFVGTVIPL